MFCRSAGRALRAPVLLQLQPPARAAPLTPRGPAACYGTSITSAKIQVNGVHLHYQQTGEGSHAVLLLPGMLGSGQIDFGPQLKSMNKQLFTVIAWDPRGYGKSIPPSRDFPPDFFERDAKDAVDLMQALKFKKFSLLGWSDGGITALIAAARYPNLIHKLVIWGANASVTQEDVRIYNGIRDVSKWSEKVRKPLEELYGHKYFAETCEAWVDGISRFAENSDEPMSACSKMDMPLAKIISDGSNTSVKTFKKEKNVTAQMLLRPEKSRMRICERNNCAATKVGEEGREGGAPDAQTEISLQPVVQSLVIQLCTCSPSRSTGIQRSTCSSWRSPCQSLSMPKRGLRTCGKSMPEQAPVGTCRPVERRVNTGAGFLAGLVTQWGILAGAAVPEGLHPVER